MSNNQPTQYLGNQEIQKIPVREADLKFVVENLLASLSAKQRLVLSGRFGIGNGESKTLESIGKSLNITRERVRQIEADAIKVIRKAPKSENIKHLSAAVSEIIKEYGGILETKKMTREIFRRFFGKSGYSSEESRMADIIFIVSGLARQKSNREMSDFWTSADFNKKYFKALIEEIEKIFDAGKRTLSLEEILKKISYSDFSARFPEFRPEHAVSALEVAKKFGKNVFGDWGRAKWPLVKPRGVREKATLALMKKRKPLHFKEISRLIEEFGLSQKKVHSQTVHNELIRDKRFVLVGRGTYALREWGYEEGTVKDVIISLLKLAGGFLSREKLYQGVLEKRKVKKATIAVNLADKNAFEKKTGGYNLKVQ